MFLAVFYDDYNTPFFVEVEGDNYRGFRVGYNSSGELFLLDEDAAEGQYSAETMVGRKKLIKLDANAGEEIPWDEAISAALGRPLAVIQSDDFVGYSFEMVTPETFKSAWEALPMIRGSIFYVSDMLQLGLRNDIVIFVGADGPMLLASDEFEGSEGIATAVYDWGDSNVQFEFDDDEDLAVAWYGIKALHTSQLMAGLRKGDTFEQVDSVFRAMGVRLAGWLPISTDHPVKVRPAFV